MIFSADAEHMGAQGSCLGVARGRVAPVTTLIDATVTAKQPWRMIQAHSAMILSSKHALK